MSFFSNLGKWLTGEDLKPEKKADAQEKTSLEPSKIYLKDLDEKRYEYPWDSNLLNILKKSKVEILFSKKIEEAFEANLLSEQKKGCRLVTAESHPNLFTLLQEACDILNIEKKPDLYLNTTVKENYCNCFTFGAANPVVILEMSEKVLTSFKRDELLFILGHELGHFKSWHCFYDVLTKLMSKDAELAAQLLKIGLWPMLVTSATIKLYLENWQRMSEFTADRAGLLCCQNINAVVTCFIKMEKGCPFEQYARIDGQVPNYIQEARSFEADSSSFDKFIRFIKTIGSDHPLTILRIKELLKWQESGEYQRILDGLPPLEENKNVFIPNPFKPKQVESSQNNDDEEKSSPWKIGKTFKDKLSKTFQKNDDQERKDCNKKE